jgi:hypothetical protein
MPPALPRRALSRGGCAARGSSGSGCRSAASGSRARAHPLASPTSAPVALRWVSCSSSAHSSPAAPTSSDTSGSISCRTTQLSHCAGSRALSLEQVADDLLARHPLRLGHRWRSEARPWTSQGFDVAFLDRIEQRYTLAVRIARGSEASHTMLRGFFRKGIGTSRAARRRGG